MATSTQIGWSMALLAGSLAAALAYRSFRSQGANDDSSKELTNGKSTHAKGAAESSLSSIEKKASTATQSDQNEAQNGSHSVSPAKKGAKAKSKNSAAKTDGDGDLVDWDLNEPDAKTTSSKKNAKAQSKTIGQKSEAVKPKAKADPVSPQKPPVAAPVAAAKSPMSPEQPEKASAKKKKSKKKTTEKGIDPALEPSSNASGIVNDEEEGWQTVSRKKKKGPGAAGSDSEGVVEAPEASKSESASAENKATLTSSKDVKSIESKTVEVEPRVEAKTDNASGEEPDGEGDWIQEKSGQEKKSKSKKKKSKASDKPAQEPAVTAPSATASSTPSAAGGENGDEWTVVGRKKRA